MRQTTYAVLLSEEERTQLRTVIGQGTAPACTLPHARILLKADQGVGGPAWVECGSGISRGMSNRDEREEFS